jgi:DNA ligase-associated metallophosphoesterase
MCFLIIPNRESGAHMSDTKFAVNGVTLVADRSGALWWPDERVLIVADLHLEKGSSFARTGQLLPPYDSRATISRLNLAVTRFDPKTIVCLGDNFHDREGPDRLDAEAKGMISLLQRKRRLVWIEGNHDAAAAVVLGGECAPEIEIGPLVFRHEPRHGRAAGELAGHLHPVAIAVTRARHLRRRCFVSDGERCVLPAFGAYTGGLDVFDPAFAPLFPESFQAFLIGRDRVYPFAHSSLAAE